MSIWSELKGTVQIHTSEHFSLKKYTNGLFDENILSIVDVVSSGDNEITYNIRLSVCLDGEYAFKALSKWVEGIPGKVDVEITVRVLK